MTRWYAHIAWNEAPHLGKKEQEELLAALPAYQRDARSKGLPVLGSGLIYPMAEEDYTFADFKIPAHWRRAWALDTGWNWTAAVWGAKDPDADITYLYSCYRRGHAEPVVHADAIKSRGNWIPGVGDAATRNQTDGRKIIDIYKESYDLDIELPDKAVEAGIYKVWSALTKGSLKVFASLTPWFDEVRFYSRDSEGKIVKKNDHLMDATRYLLMSGMNRAKAEPVELENEVRFINPGGQALGWMGT